MHGAKVNAFSPSAPGFNPDTVIGNAVMLRTLTEDRYAPTLPWNDVDHPEWRMAPLSGSLCTAIP